MTSYTPVSLKQTAAGVEVPVRAIAGASRSEISGVRDGALLVKITTAPEKGKANRAIVELLASSLSCRKSDLELIRGERHRSKVFLVSGTTAGQIEERLIRWTDPDRESGSSEEKK
jgi:uncharacterized protein (TIGR00251 family)